MTDGLTPYPAYKDSGVSWLGEIPAHWDIKPGLAAYRAKQEKNVGMIESTVLSLSYGHLVVKPPEKLHGLVPESFETYQIINPGDIVIRPTDLQNDWNSLRVGLARNRGIITSAYLVLRPTGLLSSEFGYYLLHTYDLKKIFYGMGSGLRQNLDWTDLKRMPIFIPSPDEQSAIVRYLDHANQRIDRYIRAKRKLIALLNEQKHAIIFHTVTRGLYSGKPSNYDEKPVSTAQGRIPWLASLPKHWECLPSSRLFSVRKDLAMLGDVQLSATQAYGVIPQAEFEQKVGRRVVKISLHLEKRRHVEKDDFVISMRSFQGGLERAWASGCIRSSYVVLRPVVPVDIGYFSYLFKSWGYIQALQATANFIRDGQDLNFNNFCRVDLPVPPIGEQKAIADFLNQSTIGINAAINQASKEIELIREYRTRLIADVVTGKVDVRAAAQQLPATEIAEPETPAEIENDELVEEVEAEE